MAYDNRELDLLEWCLCYGFYCHVQFERGRTVHFARAGLDCAEHWYNRFGLMNIPIDQGGLHTLNWLNKSDCFAWIQHSIFISQSVGCPWTCYHGNLSRSSSNRRCGSTLSRDYQFADISIFRRTETSWWWRRSKTFVEVKFLTNEFTPCRYVNNSCIWINNFSNTHLLLLLLTNTDYTVLFSG